MGLIRRLPLEAGIEALLPPLVFLFVCGSSSVAALVRVGGPGRWAALFVLAGLAVVAAVVRGAPPRRLPGAWAAAGVLLCLCIVSAGWSIAPRLTIERSGTLVVLFVAGVALAVARTSALTGILRGIAAVAVGSLLVVVVARHDAILSATAGAGWRFRGLGQNPNTVSMLLAVGLPLALWRYLTGAAASRRIALGLALLFAGEVAVSGSRGALVAGFAGALVVALACGRSRRAKAGLVSTILALAVACALTPKLQGGPVAVAPEGASGAAAAPSSSRAIDAETVFRLEDELGHPPLGAYRPPVPRTFLGSSGRVQAWNGGAHQGEQRPALGYGFGTEDRVFVDRFYAFEGGYVENTYIGLFLQFGAVGVVLFIAFLALLAWSALRIADTGAAALGVLVAAALLGVTQSGLLSVGNIAATSIWLAVLPVPLLAQERV